MAKSHKLQKIARRLAEAANPGPIDYLPREISAHAYQSARQIRGAERPPAIIIQGICRRSGTNYLGELLHRHPGISDYPNRIWETPFLGLSGDILEIQEKFFLGYEANRNSIGAGDFLPIFGAALLAYLFEYAPTGQRMLLKAPSVRNLHDFFYVFPNENLIVNARDGRDTVASMVKTWPEIPFPVACRIWDQGAQTILNFNRRFSSCENYLFFRYEEVYGNPAAYIRQVCRQFGLDEETYPYQELENVPLLGSSSTIDQGFVWSQKPADYKPTGRWIKWPAYKKAVFKWIAGRSLISLGYAQDSAW
jgi:protein-tyrosine sulfotransferase